MTKKSQPTAQRDLPGKNLPKTGSSTSLASLPPNPYSIVTKPAGGASARSSETQSMVSSTDTFYMSSSQRSMSSSNNNLASIGKKGDDMNHLIKRNIQANRNVETPDLPTKLEAEHLVERFPNSKIGLAMNASSMSPYKQNSHHGHRANVSVNPGSISLHSGGAGKPINLAEANKEAFAQQLCAKLKSLSTDDNDEDYKQTGFKQQPSFISMTTGHDNNRRRSLMNSNTSHAMFDKTQLNFNHPATKTKSEQVQHNMASAPAASLPSDPCIYVMYYPPGEKQPFVEKFYGHQIRLCDFKVLMASNGIDPSKCKFYFQNQLNLHGNSMTVFEPITDDQALLPVSQGRVEAKIQKID